MTLNDGCWTIACKVDKTLGTRPVQDLKIRGEGKISLFRFISGAETKQSKEN
ncbi:hypothetical protein M408DRAFT_239722 [Serendipita vermifera MAFF 305830]|uniref:Uncharacterized protein n=1 Tax=Serendipita vermifera MAFF 305830 TaxID=933852 RepID=A0A0C2X0P5_SERVB|nr:hypothetical protein M408DRAFT_239722 [Serendipita vermifera MAFF 305830]